MALQDIVIIGSGGLARQIVGLVEDINDNRATYNLLGFISKDPQDEIDGVPVLGDDDRLASLRAGYVLGVEDPALRRLLAARAEDNGLNPVSLVHPTARVDRRSRPGPGAVIFEGANVVYGARTGWHIIMNLGSIASHDCVIGDFVELTSNATVGARVQVGDDVMMGMSSVILNDLSVGSGATIGAGAVVTRNVEPGECVVGVPARPLRKAARQGGSDDR
ncbi:NeuD/PglB/VioB family sugar acetyltransferase [Saccharomonospora sp. NPDC046836]|uniref:NeuD/PglB/VioB family sugar acetyltransferase n=1 Tax=Saccharomonospora sp. NPDC046836 TaxID=3156921 RepID=UPI0033FD6382